MRVERLLQIHIATLAALGTLLLGMGQRSATMPLLVLMAAPASIWLTDITRWFRLSRMLGNVAALAVLAFSLQKILRLEGGEAQVMAIAHLLIFLQIILLFQEKDARIYGQLTMLSLLEVVVAALFNQGLWFGVLLLLEFAVGLAALVLLFLLRQWRHYGLVPPLPQRPAAAGRWPLAGAGAAFAGATAGTAWAGIGRELFGRLTIMASGTLCLTLLMFFTVPRFGQATWQSAIIAERHVVGFDDTVTLGELGEIVESSEEVLRLQLLEHSTGKPYPVQEAVYLRGAILTHYQRGKWAFAAAREGDAGRQENRGQGSLVLQRITVEPLDRPELFCVWPFVPLRRSDAVQFDFRRQRLERSKNLRGKRFSFELGTTAFVDEVQALLVPCNEPLDVEQLLQLPDLPRLGELAQRWDREAGLPPEDRVGRAHNLERKLRDSGMFQYSLEGQKRNPTLDPIEDFITEHPQGHCEYFASALALMLRSQGIPSRAVVGYRCDDWNDLGGFYDVRQLHAHSWVEAYLAPAQIPADLRYGDDPQQWSAGGWLRLDATPGTGEGEAIVNASALDWLRHGFRWLQSLWVDYVVEMDRDRQRAEIYQPVLRAVGNVFRRLGDAAWWRSLLAEIAPWLGFSHWGQSGWWMRTLLIVVAGLLLLRLAYRGLRRLARHLGGRFVGRAASPMAGRSGQVEFYRRLEILLARHGLVRSAGQTQREFATAAGARMAQAADQPRLATLPVEVADAFYRVRFGRLPLDNPQAEAVEHALAELADLESAVP